MSDVAPTRRKGLGKGFEALLGTVPRADELRQVPVGSITPNGRQPRKRLGAESVAELAESIRVQGVIQPIIVRPAGADGFELIAGERRWRAARMAGLATVPAIVTDVDDRDSLIVALVENVAREDLSPVEEARAYASLVDEFGLTLSEVSERAGRSKSSVSNRVRLLELSDEILALLERGDLTEGHARAVLSVPDREERLRLARAIARGGLSVRAAEQAARLAGARTTRRSATAHDPALADRARDALSRLAGVPVNIAAGRVEIRFANDTELAEIVEALERFAPTAAASSSG
jgi:ParB family chromosome partitioning protein